MNRSSYCGSRPYRLLVGGLFVIFVGLLVWALYSAFFDSTAHPSDRQAAAWACLLAPAILCFLGWVLREMSAVYTVDGDGIEKRIWRRFQRLDWDDVLDFHVSQDRGFDYKLIGRAGPRMAIRCSWVGRDRDDLTQVLNEKLGQLKDRHFEGFDTGRRYHPGRIG